MGLFVQKDIQANSNDVGEVSEVTWSQQTFEYIEDFCKYSNTDDRFLLTRSTYSKMYCFIV